MRLCLLIAPALFVVACSEPDPVKPPPFHGSTGSGSSSSSGGEGGGGVGGGAGGGAAGGAGQGGAGQGGADAGTGGPTDAGAADPPCTNDYAYWALGMSFVAPTPQPLGLALSELAYDLSAHPISIVLKAKGGVADATLGVSATADNGSGSQIFPAATKPTLVPALLSFGGFQSGAPQVTGVLHLVDMVGSVDIELNNITVLVTTSSNCSNIVATLNAEIPPSEFAKTLHLKAGDSTVGDLSADGGGGGQKDAGPLPTGIRAFFTGETISFDFTTL